VTRRILLVLLAFTAVIIAGAMVPLALNATGHDRTSFIEATVGVARTDAAVAQARLDAIFEAQQNGGAGTSPVGDAPLLTVLNEVEQAGDRLLILTAHNSHADRIDRLLKADIVPHIRVSDMLSLGWNSAGPDA